MKSSIRWMLFLWVALFSLSVFVAAVIETATGQVSAGASAGAATAIAAGGRIQTGSVVITGPKSLASLRFDDGHVILLHENSEFRVAEFSYSKDQPANDRFVVELLRGALRSVTALIRPRHLQAYAFRTPVATIGIRGTDFMLAYVNPLYMSVLAGTIQAVNTVGAVTFAAGTTGLVSTATTLAAIIPAAALPASVAATFSQLSSIVIGAAGAATATGAAVGGVTPAAAAVGAAVAAGVAAAVADQQEMPAGTSGTSGTTGTR